jgi:hypothetical protein
MRGAGAGDARTGVVMLFVVVAVSEGARRCSDRRPAGETVAIVRLRATTSDARAVRVVALPDSAARAMNGAAEAPASTTTKAPASCAREPQCRPQVAVENAASQ